MWDLCGILMASRQPEYTSFSPQSLQDSEGLFTLDSLNTPPSVLNQYRTVRVCSHWTAWIHLPSVLNQYRTVRVCSHWTAWIHLLQSSITTGQWGPVHTGQPEYTSFSPQSVQDSEGLFTLDSLNTPPSVLNHYRTVRACSHWTAWIHLLQSSINTGQWGPVHTGQPEYTSFSPQSVQDSEGLFTLDSLNTPPSVLNHYRTVRACSHWTAWIHLLQSSITTGQWVPVHTGQPEYTSFSPQSVQDSEGLFTLDSLNTPPSVLNHYRTVRVCSHWTAWIHLPQSSISTGQWGSVHTGQPEYTSFSPQSLQDSEGLFTLDSLNTPPSVLNQYRTVRACSHWTAWIHLLQSSINTGQWGPVHTGQPEYTSFSPQSIQDSEGLFTLDSLNTPPSVLNQYRTVRVCSHWTAWIHLLQSSISTGQWGSVHTAQPEYTSLSPQSLQDSEGLFTLDSLNTPPSVLNHYRTVRACSHWTAWIHLLQSSITVRAYTVQDSLNTPPSVLNHYRTVRACSHWTPEHTSFMSSITTGQSCSHCTAWIHLLSSISTGPVRACSHWTAWILLQSWTVRACSHWTWIHLSPQSIQDSEGLFTLDSLNTPPSVLNHYRTVRACSHWTAWIHLLQSSITTGQWGPVHTGQPEYTSFSPQSLQDSEGLFTLDSLNTPPSVLNHYRTVRACSHWTAWIHLLQSSITTGQWGPVHTGQPEYTSLSPQSLQDSEGLFTLDSLNTPPSVLNQYRTVRACSHWTAWIHLLQSSITTGQWGPVHTAQPEYTSFSPQSLQDSEGLFTLDSLFNTPPSFSPQSLQDSEGLFTLDSLNTPPSVLNQYRTVRRVCSHWTAWIHLLQSSITTGQWGPVHTGQPEYTSFSPQSIQDSEGLFTLDSLNTPPSVLNQYRTVRVCSHCTAWIHLPQSSICTGQWGSVHTGQPEYTSLSVCIPCRTVTGKIKD